MRQENVRPVLLAGFGRGARTSAGTTWAESWSALRNGRRGFESLDASIAGWPDDAPVARMAAWPGGLEIRGRAVALARALGRDIRPDHDALRRANPGLRLTVVVASSHGESGPVSDYAEHLTGRGPRPDLSASEAILCDGLLSAFLDGLGASWPGTTVSAACASACVAAGLATARIRAGACDACLVVSLDVLSRVAHAGFRQIGAMSAVGCRPFDRRRDGTTIGEAGAVLLFVGADVTLPTSSRQAAEVLGFGQSCDARHPVEPSAEGVGDAIEKALAEAERRPSEVSAIYWHGTGTVQNDQTEAEAAGRVFGADVPPGTSTKGVFGHAMGASAALSLLAAHESLTTRRLPPVAALEEPEFPHMNLVQDHCADLCGGPIVVVALGFGGINASLVLGESRGGQT